MNINNELQIKANKLYLVFTLVASLLFIFASYWILENSQSIFKICGALTAMLFCSICALYSLPRITNSRPCLVLNDAGFVDNSSGFSSNLFISWSEVKSANIIQMKQIKFPKIEFLVIYLKNPEKFINKANPFKRFWMLKNYKAYGSPIFISSLVIAYPLEQLCELMKTKLSAIAI